MLAERPKIEEALQAVFSREGFTVRRVPAEHAGGKWQLRYPSAGGQGGNLEVDVNFMFRIPLWPVKNKDWRTVTPSNVDFNIADLEQRLIPTLRAAGIERIQQDHFGEGLVEDCRNFLAGLLPFTEAEMEFLNRVLDKGEIIPELLTDDVDQQDRIRRHPLLEWKAVNVREFSKRQ